MIYIIYYFKSNKLRMKEEYESAYLCGFLGTSTTTNIIPRNTNMDCYEELIINDLIEMVFLKPYFQECLEIMKEDIKKIKSNTPNCKIILFGNFSKNNYDILLKKYNIIDAVIVGDLESTCYELVFNKIPLLKCPGMATMNTNDLIVNEKPKLIDLNLIPAANRKISLEIDQAFVEVQFSKGCLFNCSFCVETKKKPVRFKSIDLCVKELEDLNKNFGFKYFTIKDLSFEDRNVLLNKNQLDLFAEKILEKGLNIYYCVHFRASSFTDKDKQLLNKLRKSGLNNCLVGIESFVEYDLNFYEKGIRSFENINFIKLLKECFIEPSCSFIFIHSLSRLEDIKYNIEKTHDLNLTAFLPPLLNVMTVHKNTKIYEKLNKLNMIYIDSTSPYNVLVRYNYTAVENMANVFKKQFMNKKIWDLYYPIKLINININDLNFKFRGNLLFNEKLLASIYNLLYEINNVNYKLLVNITELCEKSKIIEAEELFDKHHNDFANRYSDKLKDFRILLLKEIKGNEKILENYRKKTI